MIDYDYLQRSYAKIWRQTAGITIKYDKEKTKKREQEGTLVRADVRRKGQERQEKLSLARYVWRMRAVKVSEGRRHVDAFTSTSGSNMDTVRDRDARSNVSNCKRLRLDSFQKNARPLPAFTLIHSSTPCLHPPQLRAKRNYTVFLNRLFFNAGCGEIELKWTKSVFSARGKCKHDAAVLHQPSFVLHPPDGAIVIPLYST